MDGRYLGLRRAMDGVGEEIQRSLDKCKYFGNLLLEILLRAGILLVGRVRFLLCILYTLNISYVQTGLAFAIMSSSIKGNEYLDIHTKSKLPRHPSSPSPSPSPSFAS